MQEGGGAVSGLVAQEEEKEEKSVEEKSLQEEKSSQEEKSVGSQEKKSAGEGVVKEGQTSIRGGMMGTSPGLSAGSGVEEIVSTTKVVPGVSSPPMKQLPYTMSLVSHMLSNRCGLMKLVLCLC